MVGLAKVLREFRMVGFQQRIVERSNRTCVAVVNGLGQLKNDFGKWPLDGIRLNGAADGEHVAQQISLNNGFLTSHFYTDAPCLPPWPSLTVCEAFRFLFKRLPDFFDNPVRHVRSRPPRVEGEELGYSSRGANEILANK